MVISARSYLTAGISLTAATAIAFTPLAIPAAHPTVSIPTVVSSDIQLTVSPSDIVALIANLQASLNSSTNTASEVAGIPGQTLIGVATTIEALFDVGFSGLIGATDDPTLAASLTILKTLSVDAYAMLAHNLGRINPVITGTTTEVGSLLSTALTGSLQNVLVALVNVVNDPLSLPGYAGLLAAGLASGQLLAGNGFAAVQSIGDAGSDIVGIATDELTFQFTNAVSGLSALATQLGDASGTTGHRLAIAPAPVITERSAGSSVELQSSHPSPSDDVVTMSVVPDDDVPVVEETRHDDVLTDDTDYPAAEEANESVVDDNTPQDADADDDHAGEDATAASEQSANTQETSADDPAPKDESADTGPDHNDSAAAATKD